MTPMHPMADRPYKKNDPHLWGDSNLQRAKRIKERALQNASPKVQEMHKKIPKDLNKG